MLFGLVLKNFALFGRVPGAMKHACLFCTGMNIAWMACIYFLALASTALLGVGWWGGSSSLLLPAKTFTSGFCPLSIFGRCPSFVDCLRDFHALEHLVWLLVGPPFKILPLYVGFFAHELGTTWRIILLSSSGSIFLVPLDPGKGGR